MIFVQHHSAGDQNSVTLCYQLELVDKNAIFSSLNAHVHPPPAVASPGREEARGPSFCWDFPQCCYSKGAYSTLC